MHNFLLKDAKYEKNVLLPYINEEEDYIQAELT